MRGALIGSKLSNWLEAGPAATNMSECACLCNDAVYTLIVVVVVVIVVVVVVVVIISSSSSN